MKRSITTRLVVMFALGALATLTLIGAALYGVLERELTRHQNDELNTNLQIDLIARKAWRGAERIDLSAKEFALLAVLARRQGEILSKTAIAELVWDMNFDSNTNVVEVAIKRLRAKVDNAFTPKLLHTIRGMGYVMEARDEAGGDAEPAP